MIGRTLSHYRIVAPLGQGGMGVVWRARDLHLERDVALKVLPQGALADEAARKRFRREALALSRLNHPHIATVFDFDSQDGTDFLVMELVEGESLGARIARGALPEAEVRTLGAQIADALEAAHEQGIIHRDLKPGNIMRTGKGEVKVLDFGLAQLVRPGSGLDLTRSLTETGVTLGTLPYMAPEQVLGQAIDTRADLYALGVVLYEMASGRSPYRGTVPTALIYEIVNQPVVPLQETVPGVSAQLEAIVLRCLEKAPEARYPSARASADDLREAARPVVAPTRATATSAGKPTHRRLSWTVPVAATGIVLALLGVAYLLNLGGVRTRIGGGGGGTIRALAVLPLENLSHDPEQEYFADGMTDELITRLAQVAALRVISRGSSMQYKGTKKRLSQIARELHVDAVVEGAVMRAGPRARISAQLIRVSTDQNLWGDSFEGDFKDVFSLQSQVARAIVEKVQVNMTARESLGIASARPVDPAVNEAVLKGRYYINQASSGAWEKGLQYFEQAVRLDPGYAPAYAGLATAYIANSNISMRPREAMPKAKAAALKALEIDPGLGEALDQLAYVKAFYDWDWDAGGSELRRALDRAPGNAVTRWHYGYYLTCVRRFDEASTELQHALELDPLSTLMMTAQLWPLYESRRYNEAIAAAERKLGEDSTLAFVRLVLGQALIGKGEPSRAVVQLRKAAQSEQAAQIKSWLACAFIAAGQRDSALVIRDTLRAQAGGPYAASYALATVCAALGDRDLAFEWLDQAIEERSEDVAFLLSDPGMDPLRNDQRFAAALRKVGFVRTDGAAAGRKS